MGFKATLPFFERTRERESIMNKTRLYYTLGLRIILALVILIRAANSL